MNYKNDPKVKTYVDDLTEEMLKDGNMDDNCFHDEWWGVLEYGVECAVDYNYYVDEGDDGFEDNSRFYGCFPDDEGNFATDCSFCSGHRYIIDFSEPDWKGKLVQAAYEFLINECLNRG